MRNNRPGTKRGKLKTKNIVSVHRNYVGQRRYEHALLKKVQLSSAVVVGNLGAQSPARVKHVVVRRPVRYDRQP